MSKAIKAILLGIGPCTFIEHYAVTTDHIQTLNFVDYVEQHQSSPCLESGLLPIFRVELLHQAELITLDPAIGVPHLERMAATPPTGSGFPAMWRKEPTPT